MLTLKQLRYFDALARHRHFGRAAADCAISQPALSMQIQELERALGVDLVERRPNEVTLTEIGAAVAQRAERLVSGTRDLEEFARHRNKVLTGGLRLGVIPSLAPYLLPRLLPVLQERHPQLRLELRETQTRFLIDELSRGGLDAVILALPVDDTEIETLALFDDPFLLALPAGGPVPRARRVSADDVDRSRLILLEEGHCLRDQALAFCAVPAKRGARTADARDSPVGLGAASLTTVMQMVANGYGVTLVPQIAVEVEARDERIKVLRFRDPEPVRSIGLAWRRTSPRAIDFRALGEIVTETMARNADHVRVTLNLR